MSPAGSNFFVKAKDRKKPNNNSIGKRKKVTFLHSSVNRTRSQTFPFQTGTSTPHHGPKKRSRAEEDEEILSDGSDIDPKEDVVGPEVDEEEEEQETADEKRLRLAKAYLEEIEREGKERFLNLFLFFTCSLSPF